MSVDLWSDIIAMEYPFPLILRLYMYIAPLMKEKRQYLHSKVIKCTNPYNHILLFGVQNIKLVK